MTVESNRANSFIQANIGHGEAVSTIILLFHVRFKETNGMAVIRSCIVGQYWIPVAYLAIRTRRRPEPPIEVVDGVALQPFGFARMS